MSIFSAALDALDEAVAATLSDDTAALLRPAAGGDDVTPIRVMFERPSGVMHLQEAEVVRDKTMVWLLHAEVPVFRKDDVVIGTFGAWKAAAAPTRPGDGRWWEVAVDRAPSA